MSIIGGSASSPGIKNVELNISNKTKSKRKSKKRGLKANAHKLQIGVINTTTVKDTSKLIQVLCATDDLGQEMSVLTETHRTGTGVITDWPENTNLEGTQLVYSGFKVKAQAGVALKLSRNCKLLEYSVIEAGRILYCRLTWCGVRMQVWCCYAPTNVKSSAKKDEFYRKLQKSFKEQGKKYPKWPRLILGDLNATFGPDAPFSRFLGKNYDKYATSDNGIRLSEFMLEEEMYALNTLYTSKERHRVTFKLGKTKKRLDYVLADKWFKLNCINARAYPEQSSIFESNHRLLMAEFCLPSRIQRQIFFKKHEPKPKPLLTSLRDDPLIVEEYSKFINENLPVLTENDRKTLTIDEIETRLRTTIQSAATETIPLRPKDHVDWVTPEYSELLKKYKKTKKIKQKRKISKNLKKNCVLS